MGSSSPPSVHRLGSPSAPALTRLNTALCARPGSSPPSSVQPPGLAARSACPEAPNLGIHPLLANRPGSTARPPVPSERASARPPASSWLAVRPRRSFWANLSRPGANRGTRLSCCSLRTGRAQHPNLQCPVNELQLALQRPSGWVRRPHRRQIAWTPPSAHGRAPARPPVSNRPGSPPAPPAPRRPTLGFTHSLRTGRAQQPDLQCPVNGLQPALQRPAGWPSAPGVRFGPTYPAQAPTVGPA
mmetsp:Transcript_10602/g.27830  ORF Transcript_10602/g.27830 Transcript_10602/m.27830 type:complete len:244 (-) Transcript_10602:116-847(-)